MAPCHQTDMSNGEDDDDDDDDGDDDDDDDEDAVFGAGFFG